MKPNKQLEIDSENTAEADVFYRDYVDNTRKQRAENRAEKTATEFNAQIDDDLSALNKTVAEYEEQQLTEMRTEITHPTNPSLTAHTEGRVQQVSPTNTGDAMVVTVELRCGDRFTEELSLGLPEEPSEWELLCNYVGVPPIPSELRGEVVPIKTPRTDGEAFLDVSMPGVFRSENAPEYDVAIGDRTEETIDTPPVWKRLNPTLYRLKRKIGERLYHSTLPKQLLETTLSTVAVWGSVLLLTVSFSLLLATPNSTGITRGVLLILFVPALFTYLISGITVIMMCIEQAVTKGSLLLNTGKELLTKTRAFLFPETST